MSDRKRVLPYDYCRCLDATCPQKDSCLRWLDRDHVGDRTPMTTTLRPANVPASDVCPAQIKPSEF